VKLLNALFIAELVDPYYNGTNCSKKRTYNIWS